MPILIVHFRGLGSTGARQKVRMSSISLPIQKLTLVGYALNFVKDGTPVIPDHIVVEIDGLIGQNVNIAQPPKTADGNEYLQSHGIPLPTGDSLNTVQFGMNPLEFDLNKRLDREMIVHVKKYDDDYNLVDMPTAAAGTVVGLKHMLLYFQYDFAGLF